MNKLTLYYPDGKTEFDSEEAFAGFYEQVYWYENGDVLLERRMDEILSKAEIGLSDYAQVLKWKTGGEYDDSLNVVTHQYGNIAISQFEGLCGEKADVIEDEARLFHALCQRECIGFVYAITLMHFISNGRFPIYDRFVHFALMAAQEGFRPGENIKDSRLLSPQVNDLESARFALACYESEFASLLIGSVDKRLFRQEYSRSLDRALWAYGHLFSENKRNSL